MWVCAAHTGMCVGYKDRPGISRSLVLHILGGEFRLQPPNTGPGHGPKANRPSWLVETWKLEKLETDGWAFMVDTRRLHLSLLHIITTTVKSLLTCSWHQVILSLLKWYKPNTPGATSSSLCLVFWDCLFSPGANYDPFSWGVPLPFPFVVGHQEQNPFILRDHEKN